MPEPVSRQVIVITGASSGIGLATARMAADRGAKVVLAARNAIDLERAAAEIRRDGGDAVAVPTDVTDPEQVKELGRRAVAEYGRVDAWVSNAGVSAYATFREQPIEDMRRIVEVIFWGNVHGAKVALPLLENTAGALICVGSALSDRGVPLQGAYCAAKHALKGWTESLRTELQHEGSKVRVTLVHPSSINTPLFNKAKTQLGVMPQPIPPVYEPELAAEAILRAAEGNERDVFVGGAGKALEVAERLSPKLVDLQQRRSGFAKQKTNWSKGPDAPHNLYAPVESDGGVRGDFITRSKSRSLYQRVAAHPTGSPLSAAAALGLGAVALRRTSGGGGPLAALLAAAALALAGKGALAALYEG